MDVTAAEARRNFRAVLDSVARGVSVRLTRRGRVVAIVSAPQPSADADTFADALASWREEWDVHSWPDDDPFSGVRSRGPGRAVDL